MENVKVGVLRGTGSAINVELGWIPDFVKITNVTDGDLITEGYPNLYVSAFTSGSAEIKAGNLLTDATSGATGRVSGVVLDTGTWAGGDAAGWLVFDPASIVGTWGNHNAYLPGGTNDVTITAAPAALNVATAAAVAGATGNAAISPYVGAAGSNSLGFTVGSTVSEDAKLLHYIALRNSRGPLVGNSA